MAAEARYVFCQKCHKWVLITYDDNTDDNDITILTGLDRDWFICEECEKLL